MLLFSASKSSSSFAGTRTAPLCIEYSKGGSTIFVAEIRLLVIGLGHDYGRMPRVASVLYPSLGMIPTLPKAPISAAFTGSPPRRKRPKMRKSKYAGASVSDLTRTRELEVENAKLKCMYADLALENAAMKDVIAKKY
jgi:hypothetical protein